MMALSPATAAALQKVKGMVRRDAARYAIRARLAMRFRYWRPTVVG